MLAQSAFEEYIMDSVYINILKLNRVKSVNESYLLDNKSENQVAHYEYDTKGNLITEKKGPYKRCYHYNNENLLIADSVFLIYQNNKLESCSNYKYDSKGKLIETNIFNTNIYPKRIDYSHTYFGDTLVSFCMQDMVDNIIAIKRVSFKINDIRFTEKIVSDSAQKPHLTITFKETDTLNRIIATGNVISQNYERETDIKKKTALIDPIIKPQKDSPINLSFYESVLNGNSPWKLSTQETIQYYPNSSNKHFVSKYYGTEFDPLTTEYFYNTDSQLIKVITQTEQFPQEKGDHAHPRKMELTFKYDEKGLLTWYEQKIGHLLYHCNIKYEFYK